MSSITENELIIPALKAMQSSENRTITTTMLISILRAELKPSGDDLSILKDRNDDKFSQKVRNLKSHDKLTKLGYATYAKEPLNQSGSFRLTDAGSQYLASLNKH